MRSNAQSATVPPSGFSRPERSTSDATHWRLDLLQPRHTLPFGRQASLRRQGLLSVPEGVSDANPARRSHLEVPRSVGAAERRDVKRPSLAARPRERKEGVLLDLLELAPGSDREGNHHRFEHGNPVRQPDADPVNGQDRL